MTVIKIDRYEPRIEHGVIRVWAVAGKKEYPIPDAFVGMCTNQYLAIQEATSERPEVFGIEDTRFYVPKFTGESI